MLLQAPNAILPGIPPGDTSDTILCKPDFTALLEFHTEVENVALSSDQPEIRSIFNL